MTFIVRLEVDDAGVVTGVVERVKTGRKQPSRGIEALGKAIAEMTHANLDSWRES